MFWAESLGSNAPPTQPSTWSCNCKQEIGDLGAVWLFEKDDSLNLNKTRGVLLFSCCEVNVSCIPSLFVFLFLLTFSVLS